MAHERETAYKMFERQIAERKQFLLDQVNKLNDASYHWELLEGSRERRKYGEKGLLLMGSAGTRSGDSFVFSQEGKIVVISRNDVVTELPLDGGFLAYSWIAATERRVRETLASLHMATLESRSS